MEQINLRNQDLAMVHEACKYTLMNNFSKSSNENPLETTFHLFILKKWGACYNMCAGLLEWKVLCTKDCNLSLIQNKGLKPNDRKPDITIQDSGTVLSGSA